MNIVLPELIFIGLLGIGFVNASMRKVNSEVRKKRIEELNEEIKNLDEQVVFKTKRREQKRNDAHRELCAF